MFGWCCVSINLSQSISKSGCGGEECSRKDPVGRGRRGEGVESDADETRTCWKRVVLYMGWIIKQNMSREIDMDLLVGADVRDRPRERSEQRRD